MVPAEHSSSLVEDGLPVYMGEAVGYVLRFEDGLCAYFAGDTAVFGDMRLIRWMHAPDLAFLPIGDRYTMGRTLRPSPANCWACGGWCRCTTARFRSSRARRTVSAGSSSRRESR